MSYPGIGLGPSTSVHTETVERIVWPVPEVANEPTTDYLGKRAVADMVKQAEAMGWTVRVTKAKGSWPSVGQKPSVARWSLAVRMSRNDQRAVAVYVEDATGKTWAWTAFYRWRLEQFPDSEASIGPFTDALFGPLCKLSWPGPKDWSCPYFGPVHGPDKPKKG